MDMTDYRKQIDEIDAQLTALFQKRMDTAAQIAAYKKENGLPVFDPARERAKLADVASKVRPEMQGYTESLYSTMFDLSRSYQRKLNSPRNETQKKISEALQSTPNLFPERPFVACQGVEGAYSQHACTRIFKAPNIMYFASFEGVFRAIDQGLCKYGVLPLENSTAGSVNRIYDLMMQYDFHIVRSARIKVDHCLLVNEGTQLSDIKEVISHEQALTQCENFLKTLPGVKVTAVENTAVAARKVMESGRKDLACLSSRDCAELYGLKCLKSGVQDSGSNFTRFICITKNLEIYPGADRTSIMLALPHRPGSLYSALGRLYALGINLIKLESRPLAGSDFEFMFYFDLETSVYSDAFMQVFSDIEGMCSTYKYLGSYSEVV
ncbi:MAG: chorismate mutase [Clostridia bacterium]|nr:chorismate mutase [Clostridia bacterium]